MTYSTLTRVRRDETTVETIDALAARLVEMQAAKNDYLVDTRLTTFSTEPGPSASVSFLSFDSGAEVVTGVVNDHAHAQIAERVGIPRKYYDRLRVEAPALLDTNVGHWFREKPETRMIRMLGGDVRAVLSSRYKRRDNYDLMEQAILPVFDGPAGHLFEFQVASLTPERLFLRALVPSLTGEVAVGDVVQAGVQIRNSEIGKGALEITPFVWRLVCLNGLVVEDGRMRAYHVSGVQEADENARIFADDTVKADDKAFFLKARDAIRAAVDETIFGEAVAKMREANTGQRIITPATATEKLQQTYDLTDGERVSILARLAAGGSMTKWGMVNAVTAAAKDAESFDRQEEMERLGGRLLRATSREWDAIALAR